MRERDQRATARIGGDHQLVHLQQCRQANPIQLKGPDSLPIPNPATQSARTQRRRALSHTFLCTKAADHGLPLPP